MLQASLTSAANALLVKRFEPFLFLSLQAGSCDSAHIFIKGCQMFHVETAVITTDWYRAKTWKPVPCRIAVGPASKILGDTMLYRAVVCDFHSVTGPWE